MTYTLINLDSVQERLGDYQQATDHLDQGLALLSKRGPLAIGWRFVESADLGGVYEGLVAEMVVLPHEGLEGAEPVGIA